MNNEVSQVRLILITLIDRPEIPDRMTINPDEIKELADSIAAVGLKQPILLRPKGARYEIVAGDRRYQACLSLGLMEVKAFVEEMSDEDTSILRATENLQRKDLTVIEEARIYERLHDKHGMTWEQIGKRTGKTPGLVKRRVDLLRMPELLISALHQKLIGYAAAEELFRLPDLGRIEYYLSFAIDHGATKEVIRGWVDEELAATRQRQAAGGGGGGSYTPPDSIPVYISCDICRGPTDVMKMVSLRICPECAETIKRNM
jgi:ParB family chromosome partitioning protein